MGFHTIKSLPELKLAEGIMARVVNAESMSIAYVHLVAGAVLPRHSHINEQVVNVIEGHLELEVEGTKHDLVPGTSLVLAPNVPHSGRAIKECRVIDVFHPVREDFRSAGPAQD